MSFFGLFGNQPHFGELAKIGCSRRRPTYDKRADIHEAFHSLGCALICRQSLRKTLRTA